MPQRWDLLRFWVWIFFTWVGSVVSVKVGLCFLLCRTAMLHCFAPKPLCIPNSPTSLCTCHCSHAGIPHLPPSLQDGVLQLLSCLHPPSSDFTSQGGQRELREPLASGAPGFRESPQLRKGHRDLRWLGDISQASSCLLAPAGGYGVQGQGVLPGSSRVVGLPSPPRSPGEPDHFRECPLMPSQSQAGATHGQLQP